MWEGGYYRKDPLNPPPTQGNFFAPQDVKNKYRYNGKEFIEDFDIGLYDYGARWYDPGIGRFMSVDPLADQLSHVSTFNYADNNPISNIDYFGLLPFNNNVISREYDAIINEDGSVTYIYKSGKGGDDVDHINWKDSNGNPLGTTKHNVKKSYTSGPGTVSTQQSNPTPGQREIHNTTPLIFDAILILSGEKLLAKLGQWLRALRTAKKYKKAIVSGLQIGTHALARASERGITRKMIETAIRKGKIFFDPKNGSIMYVLKNGFASGKNLEVATNPITGMVKTVINSRKIPKRYIPIN